MWIRSDGNGERVTVDAMDERKENHGSDGAWLCRPIAHIRTDFPEKFGIPRQSGLLPELEAVIVFEPAYRNPDALRGISGFSHLWLIWEFSGALRTKWQPMVRPPRLGGNTPMGVFATRSPFRPNPLGLSSVRLLAVEQTEHEGCVLRVGGADLMDGTPIYDVKPYLPYVDAHPEAIGGFGDRVKDHELEVVFPEELLVCLPEEKRAGAIAFLRQDPRPAVHKDPQRVYKIAYAGHDIHFTVQDECLTVINVL